MSREVTILRKTHLSFLFIMVTIKLYFPIVSSIKFGIQVSIHGILRLLVIRRI